MPGTDNAYRFYEYEGSIFRVKVEAESDNLFAFSLSVQVCDSAGIPIDDRILAEINHSHVVDQTMPPVFNSYSELPAGGSKGDLAQVALELFEAGDSGDWVSRGPIPAGAGVVEAEILNEWDKVAQSLVVQSASAWARLSSEEQVLNLII
jgi:hypothetical protein